jgi:hypothetical protein
MRFRSRIGRLAGRAPHDGNDEHRATAHGLPPGAEPLLPFSLPFTQLRLVGGFVSQKLRCRRLTGEGLGDEPGVDPKWAVPDAGDTQQHVRHLPRDRPARLAPQRRQTNVRWSSRGQENPAWAQSGLDRNGGWNPVMPLRRRTRPGSSSDT